MQTGQASHLTTDHSMLLNPNNLKFLYIWHRNSTTLALTSSYICTTFRSGNDL